MSESNSPSVEANVGPILLDIEVNDKKYTVRGKSELEAVHSLLLAPDAMIIIICHRNLPPEILRYLYNDVAPQLATFGINLPGMANCSFKDSDYSNGCKTEKLRCSCCSYQRYDIQDCKSGWVCEELQNVYYAETRERNAKETTTPKGNAHSSKTPQEPIELTPGTITFLQLSTTESRRKDERNFTITGQKFFFLSNQVSKRRIVFTNKPLPSEPHYSDEFPALSLIRLLGIRLVCEEWDKLLNAYKLQLNDVRKEIIVRDKPDPRKILLTLDKAAEAASELENMHNLQLQLLESFNCLSWYKGLTDKYTDILGTKKRMEEFGNTIQESISKKVDSLFQRASNIVSIEEAYKSREQGASMKRLSWITFIFLPLLFVASLYGMNIDLLANNPSWTTCFYIGAPVFLAVMATVLILKWRKIPDKKTKIRDMAAVWFLKYRTMLHKRTKLRDEENATTITPSILPETWLLFEAAEQRNAVVMRAIIERNFPLDVRNENDWTPLQSVARNGHEEIVDLILEKHTLESSPRLVNASPAKSNGRTALQAAAGSGHGEIVNRLLDAGADVNAEPSERDGRTALQAAAGSGHGEIVNRLLSSGANINAGPSGAHGRTALQAAAGSGHGEIVDRLLNSGADVNAGPSEINGRTALQAAAGSGHGDIVERLLDAGAEVNAEPSETSGRTALQAAAGSGHGDIVKRLLDAGANFNAKSGYANGKTALQAAAESGHGDIVKRLLDAGAHVDVEPSERNGRTALQAAAGSGHGDIVNRLLASGANIDAEPSDQAGRTALQAAAGSGHGDIVKRLLDAGANIDAEPSRWDGRTALQAAAENGHEDIVNRLLNAGVNVNALPAFDSGRTALQAAAGSGHEDIVNRLLASGANIDAKPSDWYGRTALQAAAGSGHGDIVNHLLNAGANIDAEPGDCDGRTALQAAAENGHEDIVNLLLASGANINAEPSDWAGRTALQAAAGSGHGDIVKRLLDAGADVNSKPGHYGGMTALQAAAEGGHLDVVKRLLRAGASPNSMSEKLGINWGTALYFAEVGGHTQVVDVLRAAGAKSTGTYFWRVVQPLYSVYDRQASRIQYRYWVPLKRKMADVFT